MSQVSDLCGPFDAPVVDLSPLPCGGHGVAHVRVDVVVMIDCCTKCIIQVVRPPAALIAECACCLQCWVCLQSPFGMYSSEMVRSAARACASASRRLTVVLAAGVRLGLLLFRNWLMLSVTLSSCASACWLWAELCLTRCSSSFGRLLLAVCVVVKCALGPSHSRRLVTWCLRFLSLVLLPPWVRAGSLMTVQSIAEVGLGYVESSCAADTAVLPNCTQLGDSWM
jgi:hypothetical protein